MHPTSRTPRLRGVWGLWMAWSLVGCHPQCRDGSAPSAEPDLQLCAGHREASCCSRRKDADLGQVYEHVRHRLRSQDWQRCRDDVRDLLCANCSPISAHLFDVDLTASGGKTPSRRMPGLCPEFCPRFFESCRDTLWLLYPDEATFVVSMNATAFCDYCRVLDPEYCASKTEQIPTSDQNENDGSRENGGESTFEPDSTCLCLEKVADGLANPVFARATRDNSHRLFVGEQRGIIYVVNSRSRLKPKTPFLDIQDKVLLSTSFGDERGLVGMALHPDFARSGRFFVYYSTALRGTEAFLSEQQEELHEPFVHKVRVSEMRVSSRDPYKANPDSERILLEIFKPFSNHNGGEMFFLDDGYLYITVGDGGGAGDIYNLAQNKSWFLGKVLRLDVDSNTLGSYGIPPDNPFVNEPGARPEIFAYGIRNTWRCGADPGDPLTRTGRGRVLCGDVGQSKFEEIDLLKKGANYGWRAREGFSCYDPDLCGHIGPEELPVHAYNHTVGECVTGGQFYRGCRSPTFNGRYLYGDYMSGRLFSLELKDGVWENRDLRLCANSACSARGLTSDLDPFILSFDLDDDGEVIALTSKSSRNSVPDGGLYRLVDPSSGLT